MPDISRLCNPWAAFTNEIRIYTPKITNPICINPAIGATINNIITTIVWKITCNTCVQAMAWTQVLQVIFQTIVVMILFIVAPIAGFMQIGFVILGVYILISFVKAAHGLQSLLMSGILVIFGSLFAFLGTGLIFGGILNRFLS